MKRYTVLAFSGLVLASVLGAASPMFAQQQTISLSLPPVSPEASVSQVVGVTKIAVTYHRPGVNGRKIWGGLVPFGEVWRTGADENTVISFSTDIQVNGKPLTAGKYGLHTIPGPTEWTIIFSRDTTAWGSYSYDQARDALRVTAKPEEAPHQERMAFTIDDVTNDAAVVNIRWEKRRVPISIKTDTKALTLESIRNQLKGLAQFDWVGPYQAASWALQNEVAYEEALKWSDQSIQNEERFENLSTKAMLLEKVGKTEDSAKIMEQAMAKGNALQIHGYARQLQGQGRKQEAIKVFEKNAQRHPDAWVVHVGMGRVYSAQGDFDKAASSLQRAIQMAPDNQKPPLQGLLDRVKRKEDIN